MRYLLYLLVLPQIGQAQLLDSIGSFLHEPPRPLVKLDVRGSFVSNSSVRFMGVKAGVQHAGRFQYGLGYQFLFTPVEQEIEVNGAPTIAHLRLGYLAPYAEYAFFHRGPWEVRLPVQIGIGAGSVVYDDTDGRRQRYAHTGLLLYEPAMVVQYRFFKYVGLAAGWGYRLVLHTRNDLGETLTAPIYILGIRILFEEFMRGSATGAE